VHLIVVANIFGVMQKYVACIVIDYQSKIFRYYWSSATSWL